jgi:hypothetical protein
MAHFQLLTGKHSDFKGSDKTHPPTIFTCGDIVESDTDLVAKFGSGKFRKLSRKEVRALEADDEHAEVTTDEPVKKRRKKKRKEVVEV